MGKKLLLGIVSTNFGFLFAIISFMLFYMIPEFFSAIFFGILSFVLIIHGFLTLYRIPDNY